MMACIVEFQRGQPLLVFEHFKYSKVTRPLASGEIKWRCINHKCTAFLKTFGINNDITEKNDESSLMIICMNLSATKYYNDNVLPLWPNLKQLRISVLGQIKFFVVQ